MAPQCRPGGGDASSAETDSSASMAPEDFEFCVLSSGGLALAGADAAGMCVADEVFSDGKLLPLRLSSATSVESCSVFSSRSVSRSASSSSSSCVSRSTSQKSASSSDSVGRGQPSKIASPDSLASPRRSLSSSVFYAHPSPSPRPPPRRSSGSASATAARRSTGSAPPAAWGMLRLGVVGAPDVYPPRPADARRTAAAPARGGSRSARFEQPSAAARKTVAMDKKLALGFLGAGLVCSCSPDAVEPAGSAEAAARRRRKKAEDHKNKGEVKNGQSTARRSRILVWLEELSVAKEKNVVFSSS